jgi:hypothetical protein
MLGLILLLAAVVFIVAIYVQKRRVDAMSPEELDSYEHALAVSLDRREESEFGPITSQMICPHCAGRNCVRTMNVKRKVGVSGGKATAALLTGGVSLLAVGLSRKEKMTQAHCSNCNSTWSF